MANNPNAAKNLIPAKKGEPSRNPKGRPKGSKDAKTVYREMLSAVSKDGEPMSPVIQVVIDLLQAEKDSDRLNAAKEIIDRLEGKAIARVESKNEDVTPPAKIELTAPSDNSAG